MDLKDGWPEYIDEMDRMFARVAVTGETAYVPGASRHLNFISSGDEEETVDLGTPQSHVGPPSSGTPGSSGSKRTSSSWQSTRTSPGKKVRNTAVRNMNTNMTRFNSSYDRRTEVIENIYAKKNQSVQIEVSTKKEAEKKRENEQKQVVDSAIELGVHKMDPKLWSGVVKICMNDSLRHIYLCTPVEARLPMIQSNVDMV
jgi:hypothetical protein